MQFKRIFTHMVVALLTLTSAQFIHVSEAEALDLVCQGKSENLSSTGQIHPRSNLTRTADSQIYQDGCGQNIAIMHSQLSIKEISKESIAASYGFNKNNVISSALPILHSNPTSTRKLFLDFDGYTFPTSSSDSYWLTNGVFSGLVGPGVNLQGVDLDGIPSQFNSVESAYVIETWQAIAEAFSILDIDVTTEFPGTSGLTRSGISDVHFGMTIAISSNAQWSAKCNCGGVAYQPSINTVNSNVDGLNPLSPAFAFNKFDINNPSNFISAKDLGGVIAHELGHSLGLTHDGTSSLEYFPGHSNRVWAPIMGSSWGNAIRQWSKNEYLDGIARSPGNGCGAPSGGWWPQPANKDDFVIFQCNDVPLRPDDYSNNQESAYLISPSNTELSGVIGPNSDIDFFKFTVESKKKFSFSAYSPNSKNATLDILLKIYDSNSNLLVSNNPDISIGSDGIATGMNASVANLELQAGNYYLSLQGSGWGLPQTTGYSSWASVGQYRLKFMSELQNQLTLQITNTERTNEVGREIILTTTGGSGTGAVTFQSSGANCIVNGNKLTATGFANCSVTATKASDSDYNSITSAPVSFNFLLAQATLTITSTPTNVVLGRGVALRSTGGSGSGAITYRLSEANSLCTLTGSNLSARLATNCSVVAIKAAQGNYAQKQSAAVVFTFKRSQSTLNITNRNTNNRIGQEITLTTSGGSGMGLVIFQATGNNCIINTNKLSASTATICNVTAVKSSDDNYHAATSRSVRFVFR